MTYSGHSTELMNEIDDTVTERPPPRQGSFLTLPVLFVIGWIIYEVTHQPAIAAMAMCLKFGWEDFRTAKWLLFTDPESGRGRACCWLYVASGLWQVAVIGVAMVMLTVVLSMALEVGGQQQGAPGDLLKLLLGAGFTIMFGFTFSTIATYVALLYSWKHRVRPWLSSSVHIARRRDEWPPLYGHRNRAIIPVISTLLITCFVLAPFCLITLFSILSGVLPGKLVASLAMLGSLCCIFFLLPASVIGLQNLRNRRFFAEHPADCWGDDQATERNAAAEKARTA